MTMPKTIAEIDLTLARLEDAKAELGNVLSLLYDERKHNENLLREYAMAYKELLEVRDHRDELQTRVDELRAERDELRCRITHLEDQ